jgi:hypothetical protein
MELVNMECNFHFVICMFRICLVMEDLYKVAKIDSMWFLVIRIFKYNYYYENDINESCIVYHMDHFVLIYKLLCCLDF